MRHNAPEPPPGPATPPGHTPGPHDPPSAPPQQSENKEDDRLRLGDSEMYPGLQSFQPLERCSHSNSGTPVRGIINNR